MKKAEGIFKIILSLGIFAFIAALVFRMCQADHRALEDVEITESFKSAYAVSSDVRTHAVENNGFSENGAVYAYSLIYIPESGYIQLTVRYNIRHIDDVILSYPDFKYEDVRYSLVSSEGVEYEPNIIKDEEKFNYRYFKLEFTDVDFSSDKLSVKMNLDGIDINMGEKSTLPIYKKGDTYIPYELSKKELSQLN